MLESEVSGIEMLLEEADRDIEMWLSGSVSWPRRHARILSQIAHTLNLPAVRSDPGR